jgi:hypothetical protein
MWQRLRLIVPAAAVLAVAMTAWAARASADDKQPIKGGIEGKVKQADAAEKTLTITTAEGRVRTFTVTDETTIVGPRGGKVRRRLHDPRFQDGVEVTVVAQGNTASEIHLGYDRESGSAEAPHDKANEKTASRPATTGTTPRPTQAQRETPSTSATKSTSAKVSESKPADKAQPDDEDNEIPGKIKKYDPTRRILVVAMLNGKDRSFFLAKDVKVMVKGKASKQGVEDPALKAGSPIEVLTDEGGHKVKELKLVTASEIKGKGK